MVSKKNKIIAITANTSWYVFNFRKNTILELIKYGYKVIVVAPRDDYSAKLISLGCDFRDIDIDKSGTNLIKDFITIIQFYYFFKKNNISLVLNFTPKNNIYSTIAARLNKTKTINNIAGLGAVFTKRNVLTYLVKKLYKFSQEKADFIFFQNKDDKKIFDSAGIIIPDYDILPGSGVDLNRFIATEAPNDGKIIFALVARLLIEKGISEYATSARILKEKYPGDVQFLLIGFVDENNPRAITKSQIDNWIKDDTLDFLGPIDNVESVIKNVDCVVLPSYYREGVPKSLLEAAAMAKPIVTTDNVGCRETVDDTITGYLCQSRNIDDLCAKMEKIIKHSHSERVMMGEKGREKMKRQFDEKIVIDKYLKVIDRLIN